MREFKICFKKPTFGGWRKEIRKFFCSDNSLANELLGWKPSTPTSLGIQKLWEWILENKTEIQKLLESQN